MFGLMDNSDATVEHSKCLLSSELIFRIMSAFFAGRDKSALTKASKCEYVGLLDPIHLISCIEAQNLSMSVSCGRSPPAAI